MSRGTFTEYGFGFDELSDDYKVFGIVSVYGNNNAIGKVYSLRSNSWKDVEETGRFSGVGKAGIYVSGKLHWHGYKRDIVSFDLNRHVYGVVELPGYTKGVFASVGAAGGCLSAHFVHGNGNLNLDVWVMKEYGVKESWDKMVTVPYYYNNNYQIPTLLSIAVPNGEVLLMYESTMVVYNPKSGVFTRIAGIDYMIGYIECMGIYIESLVSVESLSS